MHTQPELKAWLSLQVHMLLQDRSAVQSKEQACSLHSVTCTSSDTHTRARSYTQGGLPEASCNCNTCMVHALATARNPFPLAGAPAAASTHAICFHDAQIPRHLILVVTEVDAHKGGLGCTLRLVMLLPVFSAAAPITVQQQRLTPLQATRCRAVL
eukprot:scaffold160501_cov21-Tisochrysis_lutea.AAC.2